MPATLAFITWADATPSGGNTYNRELVTALRAIGQPVEVLRVPGSWPDPGPNDLTALEQALSARPLALVDGIVGCAAPEVVRRATATGTRVHLLVHMPLATEEGLSPQDRQGRAERETRALRHAAGIVCPSQAAAEHLSARGFAPAIATPGVRPAAAASGSAVAGRPQLLCLAAVSPTKDQVTLVRALAAVDDLPWSAQLVGPSTPGYVTGVRAEIERTGLARRITLPGPRTGSALERTWAATDLLVLPSRAETYGLVVTEALSRGIPAVVSAGTGAVEALRAGLPAAAGGGVLPGSAVPAGDVPAWTETLRTWLIDADVRRRWRQAARDAREHLPRWTATAEVVRAVLAG